MTFKKMIHVYTDLNYPFTNISKSLEEYSLEFLNMLAPELFTEGNPIRELEINQLQLKKPFKGYAYGDSKEVVIELDTGLFKDECLEEFYEVLSHELTHAKQLFLGELKDLPAFQVEWLGEIYNAPHKEMPWEDEAILRQVDGKGLARISSFKDPY